VQPLDKINALVPVVNRILFERWDPIGINDIPEAENEYDLYVPRRNLAPDQRPVSDGNRCPPRAHLLLEKWVWGRVASPSTS
jgi:hypothetical protein